MIQKYKTISVDSLLKKEEGKFHYVDSFQILVSDKHQDLTVSKMIALFMANGPKWADKLMNIRNKIAGLLALKTANIRQSTPTHKEFENCKPGDTLGIFKVYAKTDNEYVLGENDKHLNFRVSFLLAPSITGNDQQIFAITTGVTYNNALGKIYFFPVKPFHGFIIRSTLRKLNSTITS